jgi:hypothetical protein
VKGRKERKTHLSSTVTRLLFDAKEERVGVVRKLILKLSGVLEGVKGDDTCKSGIVSNGGRKGERGEGKRTVVVVGGEEHRRRVRRLLRVYIVERRVPLGIETVRRVGRKGGKGEDKLVKVVKAFGLVRITIVARPCATDGEALQKQSRQHAKKKEDREMKQMEETHLETKHVEHADVGDGGTEELRSLVDASTDEKTYKE